MEWEEFKQKSGCLLIKAIDEATIRKAVKNETMMNYPHYACPLSCPWKIWPYIEDLDDPQTLLQNLVEVGQKNAKNDKVREAEKFLKEVRNLPELHLTEDKKGQRNAEPISGTKQKERRMAERRKGERRAKPVLLKMEIVEEERRKGERRMGERRKAG